MPNGECVTRTIFLAASALPLALLAGAAAAQDLKDRPLPAPVAPEPLPPGATADTTPPPADSEQVQFSAAALEYDSNAEIVTANGDVRMTRDGDRLRADKVVWNRKTGKVVADGNVAITNPQGDVAYGESIELTDSMKDGLVDNMLVVLEQGGRLAATRGTRQTNGTMFLDHAAFSPCAVTNPSGCPKEPTWKITAVRIIYRPSRERATFEHARFNLFGIQTPALPTFTVSTKPGNDTGLLTPSVRIDRINGVELVAPVNIAFGPNRSLVVAPHIFTQEVPLMEARYRQLSELGAFSIAGYATSSRRSQDHSTGFTTDTERAFRGYLDGSGRFQLDENWSLTGSLRLVTDRTFLRRYDISYEDRLRTTLALERIDRDSYFSIAGWAVQTLRVGDLQGMQPVAFPELDYRRRVNDLMGGLLTVQVNTLAIGRKAGQDTQRAFTSAKWEMRRLTNWGQEVTLTAFGRGDLYNASDTLATTVPSYRGLEGFHTRAIGALAMDVKWPFVGELFGGTQRFTPRVQLVATPRTTNLDVPNEDARAIDLDDSNLFALNRFAGYDRWEDASRVTYGADWALDLPGVAITANIGQSYRIVNRDTLFPDGTGLSERFSDVVGRISVRYREFVTFTQRFRFDKDNLAIRRNEIDTTIGSYRTYLTAGYLRLNRGVTDLEDLQDREEIRVGGRVGFARFWSIWGSTIIDLTDRNEDVLSVATGFDPIRHRIGVAYQDDCFELGLTWKRDYRTVGDVRSGNSYLFTLAFKGFGR